MNKLIGLCGYAQSGKDTLGQLLIDRGYHRFAFADSLKRQVEDMLYKSDIDVDLTNPTSKMFWRDFLVFWGRKRRQLDKNYWVDYLFKQIVRLNLEKHPIVITDVRYANEVERILSEDGSVYRLSREGLLPNNEEEQVSFSVIDRRYDLPVINNIHGNPNAMIAQLMRFEAV